MTINENTPLKSLSFSPEVEKCWQEQIIAKYSQKFEYYSPYTNRKRLDDWKEFKAKNTVGQLLEELGDFRSTETYEQEYSDKHSNIISDFASVRMLTLLEKEGLPVESILLNSPNVGQEFNVFDVFDGVKTYVVYMDSLYEQNKIISQDLINRFIPLITYEKSITDRRDIDDDMNIFFRLISILPPEEITYDWVSKNLDVFCSQEGEKRGELKNISHQLNYSSQKKIYDYIQKHFPENLEDNRQYYNDLMPSPILKIKRLHQGIIEVDLYQYIFQNELQQKDRTHLSSICIEALNVMSSQEFLTLINEDIKVSNIETKDYNKKLTIYFSTDNREQLEKFETIYVNTLESLLNVEDTIHISWNEDHDSGESYAITNMKTDFIVKHYLFSKMNKEIPNKPSGAKLKI